MRFLGASQDRPIRRKPGVAASDPPEKAARAFLDDYGPLFGISEQGRDLELVRADTDERGASSARFQQLHAGVPVIAGELVVTMDEDKNVLSAAGEALPDLDVPVEPTVDAAAAQAQALAVVAKTYRADVDALTARRAHSWRSTTTDCSVAPASTCRPSSGRWTSPARTPSTSSSSC